MSVPATEHQVLPTQLQCDLPKVPPSLYEKPAAAFVAEVATLAYQQLVILLRLPARDCCIAKCAWKFRCVDLPELLWHLLGWSLSRSLVWELGTELRHQILTKWLQDK